MRLALVCAFLANITAASRPGEQLRALIDSGSLSDLRWPNFTRFQPEVKRLPAK